jgi:serine/threonine-protein kinase
MIVGTPLYMSPEVLRGSPSLDGRVDLYGLGGVGYFLLTGQTVFQDGSVAEVCAHHLHTSPEPPSSRLGSQLPDDLEALILRCLAKVPGDRPATAAELRRGLLTCAVSPWTEDQARAWWASHGGIGRPSGELDELLDTERFELGVTEPPA